MIILINSGMDIDYNSAIPEDEKENKITFYNYSKYLFSNRESMFRDIHENLKDPRFLNFCLGDFYYGKYIEEIKERLPEAEKRHFDFLDNNNVYGEDRENYLFYVKKVKQKIKELIKDSTHTIEQRSRRTSQIRDFFTDKVSDKEIEDLQTVFKEENGKQMAILIDLMNALNLIVIDNNDRKNKSRIHFVRCFTNKKFGQINSINNFLDVDHKLKTIGNKDRQYIRIKEQLEKIVSSC